MKWPNTITVVRHEESAYNILKALKEKDPEYVEFKAAYNARKKNPERAIKLAKQLIQSGAFILGVGEHDTATTEAGEKQAIATGEALSRKIEKPDVILVSPYDRTRITLGHMAIGWPELADVKTVEDERLREQEHGLAGLYNDWRIFQVLYPEQDALRKLQGPYWYRYPQGENVPDVRERARSLKVTIARDYREQNVMLITHHLWILADRANAERLSAVGFLDLDRHHKPVNCGASIWRGYPDLGEDGKLLLETYNEKLYED